MRFSSLAIGALALSLFTACLNDPSAEPKTESFTASGLSVTMTEGLDTILVAVDSLPRTMEDFSLAFSTVYPNTSAVVSIASSDTSYATVSGKSVTFLKNSGTVSVTALYGDGSTRILVLELKDFSRYLGTGIAKQ